MTQFEAVTVDPLFMPSQIGRAASHQTVVGVVAIVFQVAVVTLGIAVIEGIAGWCCRIIDDRTHQADALFVTSVSHVIQSVGSCRSSWYR
ncbi:hypothetical protein D3C76_1710020 [compost metagenome]